MATKFSIDRTNLGKLSFVVTTLGGCKSRLRIFSSWSSCSMCYDNLDEMWTMVICDWSCHDARQAILVCELCCQ